MQLYSNLQQTLPLVAGENFKSTINSLNLPATITTGVVQGVGAQLDQLAAAYPAYAAVIAGLKGQLSTDRGSRPMERADECIHLECYSQLLQRHQ